MPERKLTLLPSPAPGAPLVLLITVEAEGRQVWSAVRAMTEADFSMAVIGGLDWDADLTPWPAPAAFRSGAPYAGKADAWLEALTGEVLPRALAELPGEPAWIGLAGYSLAGLFALYAPYVSPAFSRIASVSGSLWYPGFIEFAREREWTRRPDRVYLSVGDREARTRNPALRPVGENTGLLAELYGQRGVPTIFELNPGGHFDRPVERTARGIVRLLSD